MLDCVSVGEEEFDLASIVFDIANMISKHIASMIHPLFNDYKIGMLGQLRRGLGGFPENING